MSTPQEDAFERRSAAEILTTLREQATTYEPVDKLLQLQRELLRLEQKYALVSDEFYRRYQAGQMGDDVEIVGWAGRYRLFLELRAAIADGLNQVIAFPVAASA
jgi:hypothetical protein